MNFELYEFFVIFLINLGLAVIVFTVINSVRRDRKGVKSYNDLLETEVFALFEEIQRGVNNTSDNIKIKNILSAGHVYGVEYTYRDDGPVYTLMLVDDTVRTVSWFRTGNPKMAMYIDVDGRISKEFSKTLELCKEWSEENA